VKPITSYGEYEQNQSNPFIKQRNFPRKRNGQMAIHKTIEQTEISSKKTQQ